MGLDGDGSNSVEQTGTEADCSGGQAVYDVTAGWTRATTKSSSRATRYSAEVIAEAPSSSSGVLPLSDFGTVNFSNSQANVQAIGTYSPDSINMASGGTTKATASGLSGGTSFSVSWRHS